MDDALAVEVDEALEDLVHVRGDERLGEAAVLVEDLEERPVLDVLHDDAEVHLRRGVRDVVHDVPVVQPPQELDLGHDGLLLVLRHGAELDLLDRDERTVFDAQPLVHNAESAPPDDWPELLLGYKKIK